ncbi:MAG: hypothetical protein R3A47_05475 [Polyangiales bacterium]
MNSIDQAKLNFDPATLTLLNVLIGLIMFGVALDIRVSDFRRIFRDPRGPLVGLGAQFYCSPRSRIYWCSRSVPRLRSPSA